MGFFGSPCLANGGATVGVSWTSCTLTDRPKLTRTIGPVLTALHAVPARIMGSRCLRWPRYRSNAFRVFCIR
jgi:hypothetical protein